MYGGKLIISTTELWFYGKMNTLYIMSLYLSECDFMVGCCHMRVGINGL